MLSLGVISVGFPIFLSCVQLTNLIPGTGVTSVYRADNGPVFYISSQLPAEGWNNFTYASGYLGLRGGYAVVRTNQSACISNWDQSGYYCAFKCSKGWCANYTGEAETYFPPEHGFQYTIAKTCGARWGVDIKYSESGANLFTVKRSAVLN